MMRTEILTVEEGQRRTDAALEKLLRCMREHGHEPKRRSWVPRIERTAEGER